MEKGCCTLNSTEQASSWPRHGLPAAAAGGGGPGGRGPEAAITGNMRQCQSGTVLFKYRYGVSAGKFSSGGVISRFTVTAGAIFAAQAGPGPETNSSRTDSGSDSQ